MKVHSLRPSDFVVASKKQNRNSTREANGNNIIQNNILMNRKFIIKINSLWQRNYYSWYNSKHYDMKYVHPNNLRLIILHQSIPCYLNHVEV